MLFFFDFLFRWAIACKFKQNMDWFVIDLFAEAKMENPSDSCRKVYFSQPLDSLFHLFSLERVIWDITRALQTLRAIPKNGCDWVYIYD